MIIIKVGIFYVTANSSVNFDTVIVQVILGHAHDTLSFELSIGDQRVFVNSGISEYGNTSSRQNQRKKKSHNTVEIDNKDSSEVWSSFRVAKRAQIIERKSYISSKKGIVLMARIMVTVQKD